MKYKFRKLISSLLILASLISMMTIFVYAEDDGTGEEDPNVINGVHVLYNRGFDDGWSLKNGATVVPNNQYVDLGSEETLGGKENRYMDLAILQSGSAGYVQYNVDSYTAGADVGGFVLEFDVRSFDGSTKGEIIYGRTGSGTNGVDTNIALLKSDGNSLKSGNDDILCELPKGEWAHIVFTFDYSRYSENDIVITATCGDAKSVYSIHGANYANPNPYVNFLRFCAPTDIGSSIAFDNIKMYVGTTETIDIPDNVYGALVNADALMDAPLNSGNGTISKQEALETALMMKVGVNYALNAGVRTPLIDGTYGSPERIDGVVMLPLVPLLDYMGLAYYQHKNGLSFDIATSTGTSYITVGRDDAIVDGEVMELTMAPGYLYNEDGTLGYALIAMDDVEKLFPGWYITYDDMGLIILALADDVLNRDSDLAVMCNYMKQFVFDLPDAETIFNDLKEGTNNFDHPYIYGNQETFDNFRRVYEEGTADLASLSDDDKELYDILRRLVNTGINNFKSIAAYDAETGTYDPNTFYVRYDLASVYGLETGDYTLLDNGTFRYTPGEGEYVLAQFSYPINPYATHNLDPDSKDFLAFVSNDCVFGTYSVSSPFRYTRKNVENPSVCGRSHYGYDCDGARLPDAATYLERARELAFNYAVTGDEDYALMTYNILAVFAKWEQWGPAHTLNGAEASSAFAITLDWCWDVFEDMNKDGVTDYVGNVVDPEWLMDMLWEKGTSIAYRACILKLKTAFPRDDYDGSSYYDTTNNWNGVCCGNLSIAAMVNLSDTDDIPTWDNPYQKTIGELCSEVISFHIYAIVTWGIDIYAPDGAYVEGPSYWGYGTNQMTEFFATLATAAGTDYGMFDVWGFDKTFHYSAYVETNFNGTMYRDFNYNDCGLGSTDSSSFFAAAKYLNAPDLASLRYTHLETGKSAGFFDAFYFIPKSQLSDIELNLDYSSEGLDLFTTRSSWDSNAMFAGIIGGMARTSHGHLDTSSYVYYNDGVTWIIDPGSESYNVYNDTSMDYRYRYYKLSAEGHNLVIITSQQANMPYGMRMDATACAPIIRLENGDLHYSNEYGSYAMFDMTSIYAPSASGKTYAYSAKRGVFLTNDRNTFVVQDEFILNGVETLYWYSHINYATKTKISEDGKTLYLQSDDKTLRMTLICQDNDAVSFQVWEDLENQRTATTPNGGYILDNILPMDSYLTLGGVSQSKRNGNYKKIAIEAKDVLFLDLAVVFEMVESETSDEPVCYEYTKMSAWEPYEAGRFSNNITVDDTDIKIRTSKDPKSEMVLIINNSMKVDSYYKSGVAFSNELAGFYSLLTDTEWFVRLIGGSSTLSSIYKGYYDTIEDCSAKYMAYRNKMNTNMDVANSIAKGLTAK